MTKQTIRRWEKKLAEIEAKRDAYGMAGHPMKTNYELRNRLAEEAAKIQEKLGY